jgi:hypothetical protein
MFQGWSCWVGKLPYVCVEASWMDYRYLDAHFDYVEVTLSFRKR